MNEPKKKIVLTEQATKFLLSLSPLAYADMLRAMEGLSSAGRLTMPDAKKNGWAKLQARLEALIAADPKIGRQSDLFAKRLRARQAKAFAKILSRPGSRAYRDYVLTSVESLGGVGSYAERRCACMP